MSFESKKVATEFGEVVVHQRGKGKLILFLHPLLFGSQVYQDVFHRIPKNDYHLVAIDWWGHGESASISQNITLENMTIVLMEIFKVLGYDKTPISLVGNSMGGMIALRFAISYPNLIDKLLLIGTSADEEEELSKKKFLSLTVEAGSLGGHAVLDEVISVMFSSYFKYLRPVTVAKHSDYLLRKPVDNFIPCINAVVERNSIREFIPLITAPTAILVGDEDVAEPIAHSEILAELIPNSTLEIVPNCGHLVPLERPDLIRNIILS